MKNILPRMKRSAEKSGEKVNELSERLDYELGIIARLDSMTTF